MIERERTRSNGKASAAMPFGSLDEPNILVYSAHK
jgi:hypothetical protein